MRIFAKYAKYAAASRLLQSYRYNDRYKPVALTEVCSCTDSARSKHHYSRGRPRYSKQTNRQLASLQQITFLHRLMETFVLVAIASRMTNFTS